MIISNDSEVLQNQQRGDRSSFLMKYTTFKMHYHSNEGWVSLLNIYKTMYDLQTFQYCSFKKSELSDC